VNPRFSARTFARADFDPASTVLPTVACIACLWLERGGTLAALQQIPGHSTIDTAQGYTGITDNLVTRDAERIGGQGIATKEAVR